MAEFLGRSITRVSERGVLNGIQIASSLDPITYHQFVDDTMLYGKGDRHEARSFKEILNSYSEASSYEISKEKSDIFFFNTNKDTKKAICSILKLKVGDLPCRYLGLPLNKGLRSSKLWDHMVTKIKKTKQKLERVNVSLL